MALCGAAALLVVMLPRVAWWCVVWHVVRAVAVTVAVAVSVSLVRARGVAGLVARAGSRVTRSMRASFGFGFGFDGSVRRGTAAAACHPKLASSCRRVAMPPLGGLGLARSRARGGVGGVESRARTMRRHPDGRADDGGAADSPARVVREDEREDKNKKTRGRRGGASAGGGALTSARA